MDPCPAIWNVLHDAIVVNATGTVPGVIGLELDCDYLRDRFTEPGHRFYLTLHDCTRFAYRSSLDDTNAIHDLAEVTARRLWILSADVADGYCKVHCSEHMVSGSGGVLELSAARAEVHLDDGTAVSFERLKTAASEYWDEFESRTSR